MLAQKGETQRESCAYNIFLAGLRQTRSGQWLGCNSPENREEKTREFNVSVWNERGAYKL